MRRILCLRLPNWPVQRLLVARPELDPKQPLILHARDPRRGQLVAACNAAAFGHGVRLQMPLAEAATLVERREECHILPADPAADLAALARLAEHCERFSPLVGWETVERRMQNAECRTLGPDHLFLDVTAIGVLFGGEEALAEEVVAELARLGYDARVAIAGTIGAAWATASSELSGRGGRGSRRAENGPETQGSAGASPFQSWNIELLRIPPETVDLLAQLGITRIEQLLKLPRTSLAARFGEQLAWRLDQLLGAAPETIVPHRPPPKFVICRLLEYPAENRELVERVIRELVEQLATLLAQQREGAMRLACRLDCVPHRPAVWEVGLFRPSADPKHLWDLARMQLEQQTWPDAVSRVTLAAPLTAPLENRQQELFGASCHEAARQWELLIDRLGSRLGPEAVLQAQWTADPVPERAVQLVSLVQAKRQSRSNPRVFSAVQRPLLLRSPPLALDVLSIVPDGPPVSFRVGGQVQKVAQWWGPERIESGWWRGRSVRRDYYRVAAESGQRYWLFRRLPDGKWYLHGEFT
jgi:protein ImuB